MTLYTPDEKVARLAEGFTKPKNIDEMVAFLRDILTEPEINEFAGRFAVAQALAEGKSQRAVAKETGISIATVTRVNQWLLRGMGGYSLVLKRLEVRDGKNKELKSEEVKKKVAVGSKSLIRQFSNSLSKHHHHEA